MHGHCCYSEHFCSFSHEHLGEAPRCGYGQGLSSVRAHDHGDRIACGWRQLFAVPSRCNFKDHPSSTSEGDVPRDPVRRICLGCSAALGSFQNMLRHPCHELGQECAQIRCVRRGHVHVGPGLRDRCHISEPRRQQFQSERGLCHDGIVRCAGRVFRLQCHHLQQNGIDDGTRARGEESIGNKRGRSRATCNCFRSCNQKATVT
mmetsp:Transcript_10199/g.31171  ORF Transcript_10199/g.31171 Transcript_10199/m.31171 type:complete len:204 (-) Transcript_10199:86-697(-)